MKAVAMTSSESETQRAVDPAVKFKRVLLKMSGEVLQGDREFGIDPKTVDRIARDVKQAIDMGVQVCIVVGAGNIFRGASGAENGMDRATGDYIHAGHGDECLGPAIRV